MSDCKEIIFIRPPARKKSNFLSVYTIQGKMKFDSANAEFGVNFYSQWPDTARKYVLMRENGGVVRLYYYSSSTSRTRLGTYYNSYEDSTVALQKEIWYNFEIKAEEVDSKVLVKWWQDGTAKSSLYGISDTSNQLLEGLVGAVTHSGDGKKYWGPITVTANEPVSGAFMAWEDFKSDTIVDIAPYTPADVHPDYRFIKLDAGRDTSGFVFNKNGSETALIYKHKPGLEYIQNLPTVCRLIPQTNLDWRDYEFSGTIEKSSQSLYDSIETGVVFYMESDSEYYCLKVRGCWGGTDNKFVICRRNAHMYEDSVMKVIDGLSFSGDTDVVNFKIKVTTDPIIGDTPVVDGQIKINVVVQAQGNVKSVDINPDQTPNRKKQGICGVLVNNHYEQDGFPKIIYGNGLRFENLKVQKAYQ